MSLRRGFKTEAREIATEVRAELGLTLYDPLDVFALAEHLDIPTVPASSLGGAAPEAVRYVCGQDVSAFSAAVVFVGSRRVIVFNDAHAPTRQRSDVAHELSHALLLHEPSAATTGLGSAYGDAQEEEATWLGGVLLVSDDFCVRTCKNGTGVTAAAQMMEVSPSLMRWRINMSGATRRAARSARFAPSR